MKAKLFEIRDRMTFIPVMAIQLLPGNEPERYLLARAGFGSPPAQQARHILMVQINGGGGNAWSDAYAWGNSRTYNIAHQHIYANWETLETGDVIDVEFILGETKTPKTSERFNY